MIFIPQQDEYTNTFHAQRIERFYALLLSRKNAELTFVSDDHHTIQEVIQRGIKTKRIPPQPEKMDGGLIIYQADSDETSCIEDAPDQHNTGGVQIVRVEIPDIVIEEYTPEDVEVKRKPIILSGSVLRMDLQKQKANIWVSIRDPYDNPIEGLLRENINIREIVNGEISDITRRKVKFQAIGKEPLAVTLVRDVSISIGDAGLRNSTKAAEMLLDRLDDNYMASMIYFSGDVIIDSNFSIDKSKLKRRLKYPARRTLIGSAIYDAFLEGILMAEKNNDKFLKAVIGFTDGHDNASKCSPSQLLETARQHSIPIFIVGVAQVDDTMLNTIAVSSGGMYCSVSDTSGLKNLYRKLSDVLRKSYLISYPTETETGDDFQIEVNVNYQKDEKEYIGQMSYDTEWVR